MFSASSQEQGTPSSFPSKRFPGGDSREYWKGNSPVLEKADYNGETLMLPKIAPRDEVLKDIWSGKNL